MIPWDMLQRIVGSDPGRPRVTCYDDIDGGRVELSGKVLLNWVSKAANLLVEEFDAQPGARVALALPAEHWRTIYWALAIWAVDGTVVADPAGADLVISDDPDLAGEGILVTLAALARSYPGEAGGALDEAAELSTYGDRFDPLHTPRPGDVALETSGGRWTYKDFSDFAHVGERRYVSGDLTQVLRSVMTTLAGDGSVVLMRGADPGAVGQRLVSEGVTAGG